jgi:xylulose-5-phosphate/fructose-6-phosphate phosphoketolase
MRPRDSRHPAEGALGSRKYSRGTPEVADDCPSLPKGWGCPKEIDGHKLEGSWRAHQMPILDPKTNPQHLALVEQWLRSYRPEELFDEAGKLIAELQDLPPKGPHRISGNPHANGGVLRKPLDLPDFRAYAVKIEDPGKIEVSSTNVLGHFLADVMRKNMTSFRVFGPDETASNKLDAIYEASEKTWLEERLPRMTTAASLLQRSRHGDAQRAHPRRLVRRLSPHWSPRSLRTYESFVHVIDSMFNQHAKWLEKSKLELRWRAPISSLNLLITSLVWRQDHNGFTHQDPGFLDLVTNKSPEITRIYLPPDANCLLSVADHCLRSTNYVNVIVADKALHLQYLPMTRGRRPLHQGHRHLGLRQQRSGP